ncbi:1947_t:CDS:2 [Cetraspora pellucida]|uniref:Riboflavin kinase n=1 Tax=Cetraspora pellucida TaxID=1433469 RepID=A0A9N9C4I8_9GLOM|nr:1947_t:CDS:2 [Cetraspora pellucida]
MTELSETTRPLLVGPDIVSSPYPIKMKGIVIQGFGRANLSEAATNALCEDVETGIYFGWAQVGNDLSVYPMVMSLGWNPYYKNEKKSAEVHIIHDFLENFYGVELRVIVLGRIRPERDYDSIDALIQDINTDIIVAQKSLERPSYITFKSDSFFMH